MGKDSKVEETKANLRSNLRMWLQQVSFAMSQNDTIDLSNIDLTILTEYGGIYGEAKELLFKNNELWVVTEQGKTILALALSTGELLHIYDSLT